MPSKLHSVLHSVLKQVWGYDSFRPLQQEIIEALLRNEDALVILPTGGGKSLCFQLPALVRPGITIVVSPLISLMKDQVDTLKEMGVSAQLLNSSLTEKEARAVLSQLHNDELKLLYMAPERLMLESMLTRLQTIPVAQFIIDEAHCVSQWGHDFRPEYRALHVLRQVFPDVPIAAFTATATPDVNADIKVQLGLKNPQEFSATVDRPNLTYRVFTRSGVKKQIIPLLERHKNEPGIIYCLSRKNVDDLSTFLNEQGYKNLPYHAGMNDKDRRENQMRFAREEIDIIVATVAFGMGIDRSNIRYVIHASMPQSLEHYQQEIGRAGRDALAAHGYLFFGAADYRMRIQMMEETTSAAQQQVLRQKLNHIYDFCITPQCRHKRLVSYFGQNYEKENCQACDFCLNEITLVSDSQILAQKILSCLIRLKRPYGTDYIVRVLKGDDDERITARGHKTISTYGILKDQSLSFIRSMIDQLCGQGYILKEGEFATLTVTQEGWKILRSSVTPKLVQPLEAKAKKVLDRASKRRQEQDWGGIDRELFEQLRRKRMELATQEGVPAFIIFGDKTLKDLAVKRPQNLAEFANVFGVGEHKLKLYGTIFVEEIQKYAAAGVKI